MFRILVFAIFLLFLFASVSGNDYQNRPKIKTSDGDLILEPAYDKSIYLRQNGPKSSIFVGDVDILHTKSKLDSVPTLAVSSDVIEEVSNGFSSILQRLEKLETTTLSNEMSLNMSTLWRKVSNLQRNLKDIPILLDYLRKDECQSDPCEHGGTCLNLVNGYHCLCPTNWEGKDCDNDVNECRNFAGTDLGCQKGACINKPGYYECLCQSGWYGLHCTRKANNCSGGDFEMCGHGTCSNVDSGEGITCICHQGWRTNGSGVACLTDVNECDSHYGSGCSVNPKVECINFPGSFKCGQCPTGFEGDGYTCKDIDECTAVSNGGCSSMVACQNTIGSRLCGPCPPAYQGDGVTCSWRGFCGFNHGGCHPSAQCVESLSLGSTHCFCPEGMNGDGIGLHGCYFTTGNVTTSCANNPCGTHGQCHMLRSGYSCVCLRGYGGSHCEIPTSACAINPCRNSGICRLDDSMATGFRCECTAQYSGPLCQILFKHCGSVLNAEEGSIVYPLSNSIYSHNSRCVWIIHTVPTKVLNVTFSKFTLEHSDDCSNGFLQIHDGRSTSSRILGRFCGNTFPMGGNIISSHNNIYLWYRSDPTATKERFALHWTSVDPVCGGEIDATTHGHISSPGSPGKYPPNRDCYWHLKTTLGKKIQFHFFALDIENHIDCSFDYLAIYDGMDLTDPLLNKYCVSNQPAPILSTGSEILIHFHSDSYGSGNGFQISYVPVPGVPGCGGYFTSDRGEITAPSYKGTYLSNVICEYKITTGADTKVSIHLKQFHLDDSLNCRFEYLKIYDGSSEESPLVGKFCGTTYPKFYVASSNILFIIFKSGDTVLSGEGFKVSYEAFCQQRFHGDSGVIKSPGYPFRYPEKIVCEYIISAAPGNAIQLTFQDFDVKNDILDHNSNFCLLDNIEIRDGADLSATLLGRYCHSGNIPPVQLSTHNIMYIRFKSMLSVSGSGFYANYTTVATRCGGIYRESTGLINHFVDSNSSYNNDQACTWILIAPEGMHIQLIWFRFKIKEKETCANDYLELIEIDVNNENTNVGKFCGLKSPPVTTTSTNRLKINYKISDHRYYITSGFSLSYTFLDEKSHCGGSFYGSHGIIYSPGWPRRYEMNLDCVWIITVPVGQQIRLNISHFDIERPRPGGCNQGDYLEIRNGASEYSPIEVKYCGKFQPKILISLANSVYIHFHSDYYLTGKGFQLEWDGSVYGCGGTLTSSKGSIASPNYPNTYNENAECFYRIVSNPGSRIRISFADLQIEHVSSCNYYYIEMFDGKDSDAPSFGKHCYMSSGLSNIETTSNYAFIKFRTDFYARGRGFLLHYVTTCNSNLTSRYGVIESINYPNSYPLLMDCLWNINAPKGNRINVTFTHFDVFIYGGYFEHRTGNKQCDQGYLQWKEISVNKYSDTFCGVTLPPIITTQSNSLQIKFSPGGFGSKTGFRLEWVSYGCGGHIQKRNGTISIDSKTIASKEMECEWLIETPIGTSVSLVILDLYITETHNCTIDAVEVYNGQNIDNPLLTRICHRHRSSVQATANFMVVKLVKRSSLKGAHFTLTFSSTKSTCGGNIHLLSGFIYSKNYPKNYDNNLDCIWVVSVPLNHRIELNILDLDLFSFSSVSDCDDSIKIFDEQDTPNKNYNYIICPQSKIRQLTTNKNKMILQFTSNRYGNAKGFKVKFSATCGASLMVLNDGIISNENYIGGSNTSCAWTLRAAQIKQKIFLTITYIFLPQNSDIVSNRSCSSSYLRVYDGDGIDAPLIDEYCGKRAPPMIVSRGSAVTVSLGTYNNEKIMGHFSAHYSSLNEACGGTLTSEEGNIASPNYPHSYPIHASCEWTLNTSPGNKVYVVFERFELEYSESCNEDYLEIRQDNGAGEILGIYCGAEIPTNTTIASKLYIKFHSNDKNNGKGFLIRYGFLHGNVLTNMDRGEIASPLYPHLYLGPAIYSWRLEPRTGSVTIIIDNIEIPSFEDTCNSYLSVYDGYDDTAPLLSELCGKLSQPVKILQSSSNMAFIKLSLDDSNSGSQFHLTWASANRNIENKDTIEKNNCGSNYTELIKPGSFSIFISPNFPRNYDNNLICEWTFIATNGRHLRLHFHEFAIEQAGNCVADYVNVYSSDISGQWNPIKENICETQVALRDFNSNKYMKIEFRTDLSNTKKGFRGQVSSLCGGLITELSGEVGPLWDDVDIGASMNYNLKCEWVIKVRPGRVIGLDFTHFNISNKDNSCVTSVTLRNGDTVEAPFLGDGKYCKLHETMTQLTTSSNYLHISYLILSTLRRTSNDFYNFRSNIRFQNFKIHYEEKGIECGATSVLDPVGHSWEIIQSPNYPLVPVPFSECIWIFTGPPGEIMRVDFIDKFDLDNNDDCKTEFVEVRDGISNLSPIIGRYCGDRPSTIKSTSNALYMKYLTQLLAPRNGFKANVSIDVCGGTIVAENGEVKSPGYPQMNFIPYGYVCVWHIKGAPRLVLTVTPLDIDFPKLQIECALKVTVEVNTPDNNITTILREFCGQSIDYTPIQTATNELVIKYHVEKSTEWFHRAPSRGFRFSFDSLRVRCGGPIRTPEGYLTTPGYPLQTDLRQCIWDIRVPDTTRRVRLEFIDADILKYHLVSILNDHLFTSHIQTIPTKRVYESSGNEMSILLLLNFTTKNHRLKAKFSSDESALCGGSLIGIYGQLTSPDLERSYTCKWHYDSRTAASRYIEHHSILLRVNCSVSKGPLLFHSHLKLGITSLVSKQSFRLNQNICTSTESTFRIPGTILDLEASKPSRKSLYFHLEWKAQPCGGIVNVDQNPVNILNIPANFNDTLDCAWMVVKPVDSRLELTMEGIFKYSCDDEYITIGVGLSATSIGNYCMGKTLDTPLLFHFENMYIHYHIEATNSSSIKLIAKSSNNKQCGGKLYSDRRIFSSPNYPKSYEPNQECTWFITAGFGNRVSLKFIDRFVVEERPNCTKDAVIIYDWKNKKFIEIARLCGRLIPQPYNSTYNKMKVVLRTDNTTNMDGFKALWTPQCIGYYVATDKKQLLYSLGFPSYPPMADCIYEISAPDDKMLLIEFLYFKLEGYFPECLYDNITITGEVHSNRNYLHNTYCGSQRPFVTSYYNKIRITFKTDQNNQREGFKLSYNIFECGGKVKEPTLLTSHIGDVYNVNMNCTWFIEAPTDKIVIFKFWYIDLETSFNCRDDYVAIYDGFVVDSDKRLALMCGNVNSTTVLRSNGNRVLLQFVSDYSYNFKGFKVEVLFTYGESVGCGGHIDLTALETMKILKSPLGSNSVVYENYLDCHWTIASLSDTVVKIEFISFNISPCSNVNQTAIGFSKCNCDLVEIRDGINPHSLVIGTYCGHTLPPYFVSSGNLMSVRLSSDGELSSSGFEARITSGRSVCGQSRFTLGDTVMRIKSPGFEVGMVPRGIHCIYYIDASYLTAVRLSILHLDLQPPHDHTGTKTCNKDKLIVANSPVPRNFSIGKYYIIMSPESSDSFISNNFDYFDDENSLPKRMEYCGSVTSSDLYVSGSMTLTLVTAAEPDSNLVYKGFDIEISPAGFCRRNYTGTQGKIQMTYDRISENSSRNCLTLITAPENHTISAHFIFIIITGPMNQYTSLNIYDGNCTSSQKLVSITEDYETTFPIYSKGRYMLIESYSSVKYHRVILFDMNYLTTDKGRGCGGKLQNELGRVTSPMYPNTYRQISSCEWELETPVGTHLKLHFVVFDLGRSCDQNYVQLVDSGSAVVGTFCSERPADYTSTENYVKIVFVTTMNNGGSGWVADFVGII